MAKFYAIAKSGSLRMNDYTKKGFIDFLRENEDMRLEITPLLPESQRMRGYFEGAIVPFITFFQEGMNHRDYKDLHKVREWLKTEFNGDVVLLGGKQHRITKSTKNLLKGFMEQVLDWCGEQGYPIELLNTENYKKWRDEIFPTGEITDPDNYIDFLVQIGKLHK